MSKSKTPKAKALARSRGWVFTLNNPTADEISLIKAMECKHIVYGEEFGESGTPHLQGYVELKEKISAKRLNQLMGNRCHFEHRRGTPEEARDYCLKGDQSHEEWKELGRKGPSFGLNAVTFEKGELLMQGKRTDIINVRTAALTQTMADIVSNEDYNYQDILIAKEVKKYCTKGRDWMPRVIWLYGPSDTGKSTHARQICIDEGYPEPLIKTVGGQWWDGYDGQEAVILDDFRDSWWTMSYNNNMLTGHNFRVENKGGSAFFVPKLIIYTTIVSPSEHYKGVASVREPLKQLLRRVTEIYRFADISDPGPRIINESVFCETKTFDFEEMRLLRNNQKSDQRSGKVIVRQPVVTSTYPTPAEGQSQNFDYNPFLVDDDWLDLNMDDGGDNVCHTSDVNTDDIVIILE